MAADPATLASIFPSFADVPSANIAYWIERAERVATWGDDHAVMLLAAHYMATNGLGGDASLSAAGMAGVKSFDSGSLSVTFADNKTGGGAYGGSTYGRQFALLLAAERGGMRVTGSGVAPAPDWRWPHGVA